VESVAASLPVRVGIYARISSDRDGDQLGVMRQLQDCERLAATRGWIVADRYVDDDISAWSGKERPEYERLLDELRARRISGVVVWHIDRLQRHPRDLEAFLDLCDEVGIDTLACVTGDIDLGTHTGRLIARNLGALARYESDHKSERIQRKHLELALHGKVSGGGSRPYGYESDRVSVVPAEAAIIRECARRFLAGESLRSISIDLNDRGVQTAAGATWTPQTLRRMLHSARISGQREHKGTIVSKAQWPAIITPEETAQIRAMLVHPERRTKAGGRYLLTQRLVCGHCGEKLVARPRQGGQRRYACAKGPGFSGCGKTYIKADDVEQFIVEAVLATIDSPEVAEPVRARPRDPDLQRWYEQLDADKAQLEELAAAYGTREITMAEWRAARTPIEERMTLARKRVARATQVRTLDQYIGRGEELRAEWDSLDLDQQRAIVGAVLDHVVIGSGRPGYNRFDESRLTPFWRP
jgi:site-specific DNA recombinase